METVKELLRHRLSKWGIYLLGLLAAEVGLIYLGITNPEGWYISFGVYLGLLALPPFGIFAIFKWGGPSK